MKPIIMNENKIFRLFGFSKIHDPSKPYSSTIFELLDKVWEIVRDKELSHKGINHVLYDINHLMFAGIELDSPPKADSILEEKTVIFQKYAYCKHVGPYSELDKTYQSLKSAAADQGEHLTLPLLEVYGHWNEDEAKLETEIYHGL